MEQIQADSWLHEEAVTGTLLAMSRKPKTEQIRLPTEVANDLRTIAVALKTSMPRLLEDLSRAYVRKEMPRAVKLLAKRAEQIGSSGEASNE